MNNVPLPIATAVEVTLGLFSAQYILRQTKYEHAARVRRVTMGDFGFALGVACSLALLREVSPWIALVGCIAAWMFLWLLWLDVALYGCFTFELGLGGARDVVLSNLAAEVFSMRSSRQFLGTHRLFLVLPLVLPLLGASFFLNDHSPFRKPLEVFLAIYFCGPLLQRLSPEAPSSRRRALWIDFIRPRRPRIPHGFEPRPEHAALLADPAHADTMHADTMHALHGRLRDRSIVLFTFESLGAVHLDKQGAHTPFLSSLVESNQGIVSAWHASPGPLTNAAHVAWYFGQWSLQDLQARHSHVSALRDAGYRTIYLTAARTAHYGLRDILNEAGFTHVIDGDTLVATNSTRGAIAFDSSLETTGLTTLEATLEDHGGPFFVHVHAHNAHVPHHVENTRKFARHDGANDRGRFLNSVEETDDLFGRLANSIQAMARRRASTHDAPLVAVSSDHGQSFGEYHYRSHASAVTAEQIQVPLVIHHPSLLAISVAFSTHFDLLPTLLDLIGIPTKSGYGQSLLGPRGPVMQFLFDGRPSRPTSSCLGLLIGNHKYSLDLVRDTLIRSSWNDEQEQMIEGPDRDYFEALIGFMAERRGTA